MDKHGNKKRLGPGLVLVHSYVYYNWKYHSRGNTPLEK